MSDDYIQCIRQFASLEVSGQAAAGGTASPLPSLLGQLGENPIGGADAISSILGELLGGSFGRMAGLNAENTDFLSDRALSDADTAEYLADNRFPGEALLWQAGADGAPVLALDESAWDLVQDLELNMFVDDGAGYIDLGLDNVFDFTEDGALRGDVEKAWLAIEGQPVAYYHTATVDDGTNYTITGYVPVLWNSQRAELLLTFDNETPGGYVSGIRAVYPDGETETVAKSGEALQPGDTLDFICDYYTYDGGYLDSYLMGETITVGADGLTVSDVPLAGSVRATYRFTDIYNQHYWTAPVER